VETGTQSPNRGSLLSARSGLRGHLLGLLKRISTVVCVALFAVTLSIAQESQTDSKPATNQQPVPSNSGSSHTKSSKSASSSPHSTVSKSKKSRKSAANRHARGQQRIDPQRTLEIQEALIREHYLDGKPTGVWNDATQRAMQRFQADNNWQSKTTPDARALIKLGLGPDHEHLLNPDSAMTSQSQSPRSISTPASTPPTGKPQQ
jgi:hypothetical protein